jgi:hypothetical protein
MEEIGHRLVFLELDKKLRKTVCFNRPWKMNRIKERRKRSLPLPLLDRAWLADAYPRAMVDRRVTCSRSMETAGEGE